MERVVGLIFLCLHCEKYNCKQLEIADRYLDLYKQLVYAKKKVKLECHFCDNKKDFSQENIYELEDAKKIITEKNKLHY